MLKIKNKNKKLLGNLSQGGLRSLLSVLSFVALFYILYSIILILKTDISFYFFYFWIIRQLEDKRFEYNFFYIC